MDPFDHLSAEQDIMDSLISNVSLTRDAALIRLLFLSPNSSRHLVKSKRIQFNVFTLGSLEAAKICRANQII